MKSERLIRLLMILQRNRASSAPELATRLGVCVRTIFRDVDALSAIGVPVYAVAGRGGGVRLTPGYKADIAPLSSQESEALALMGVPIGTASGELEHSMQTAIEKLAGTVPAIHQARATRARERLMFDPRPWFHQATAPPLLENLRTAVWQDRWIDATYESLDRSARARRLAPYALVVKVDTWYLVAKERRVTKVFHVSRLRAVNVRNEIFERPMTFDLQRFWKHWRGEFERHPPNRYLVEIEISPKGRQRLLDTHGGWLAGALAPLGEHFTRGRVTLDLQREDIASRVLSGVAAEIRILSPGSLRTRLRGMASALLAAVD